MEVVRKTVMGKEIFTATPSNPDNWVTTLNKENPDYLHYAATKSTTARIQVLPHVYEITDEEHEHNIDMYLKAVEEYEAQFPPVEEEGF